MEQISKRLMMTTEELILACRALARLVRAEYPQAYSLSEISSIWGETSPDELAALSAFDAEWGQAR